VIGDHAGVMESPSHRVTNSFFLRCRRAPVHSLDDCGAGLGCRTHCSAVVPCHRSPPTLRHVPTASRQCAASGNLHGPTLGNTPFRAGKLSIDDGDARMGTKLVGALSSAVGNLPLSGAKQPGGFGTISQWRSHDHAAAHCSFRPAHTPSAPAAHPKLAPCQQTCRPPHSVCHVLRQWIRAVAEPGLHRRTDAGGCTGPVSRCTLCGIPCAPLGAEPVGRLMGADMPRLHEQLEKAVLGRSPVVYLLSSEEDRVVRAIREVAATP